MDIALLSQLLVESPGLINDGDAYGSTVLMRAARGESLETVRWMLDHGAEVNKANRLGDTALFWACQRAGREEVVALLLERGADPRVQSQDGRTALILSAGKGHLETVRALLRWRPPGGGPGAAAAAGSGRSVVDMTDRKGRTALWEACSQGQAEVARVLVLEGRADWSQAALPPLGTPLDAARASKAADCLTVIQEAERAYLLHKLRAVHGRASTRRHFPGLPAPPLLPPTAATTTTTLQHDEGEDQQQQQREAAGSAGPEPWVEMRGLLWREPGQGGGGEQEGQEQEGELSVEEAVLSWVCGPLMPQELFLELLSWVGRSTGCRLRQVAKRSCCRGCGMVVSGHH